MACEILYMSVLVLFVKFFFSIKGAPQGPWSAKLAYSIAVRSVSGPQDGCLFRARVANRFWVQFWNHFGSILGPILASKSTPKSRANLRPFLTPILDQFWSQVGTNLDTCWCHFGELCVASTASADVSKTIKNQLFFQ